VGKTTLLQHLLQDNEHLFLNGDDPFVRSMLENAGTTKLESIFGRHNIVYIDEAQRIPNIGLTLRLIKDQFRHVQLLVSGSSALEINDQTQEPLTGRKL
jgi:predicted AAA+ superfamily ATPase